MPLEKFIPLSPDPNITTSSDMGMAQFGHLNTIVDYLNGTNALTDIKIAGDNNTPGYIDFSSNPIGSTTIVGAIRTYVNGVNLSEVMTFREDGNVGIGTTTPTARLRVITADTNGIAEFFQNGVASSPLHLTRYTGLVGINLNTAAGGSVSPVPVGDNIQMSRITTNTYNGTAFANAARIEVLTKGIQSATNYGTAMRFLTTPENATSMNEVMSLTSDGNVQIGIGYLVAGGAKLAIKGSGSTSATTSLLVQNSGGNTAFQVKDDLTANFQGRIQIEYDKISFLGSPSNTYIQQDLGIGFGYYSAALSNQIMINAQPKIIVKDTGASRASTLIVGHSVPTTDAADVSALLEVRSDALYLKGFLKPRMTTTQKNAIVTPAAGLEVFDTTLGRPCFYSGSAWVTL